MIAIIKSPQYERDITEIWDYIARQNPDAADGVVIAIENTITLLAAFPGIGTPFGSGIAPDSMARVFDLLPAQRRQS